MGSESKTRLGILGGTFNPVHLGHLVLAQTAAETCDLARVLFVPSALPPHKENRNLLPARHRVAMLESALEDDLRFEICDTEIRREGISYTIDTLKTLKELHPAAELCFIIGSDTLPELHSWRRIEELFELCTFVTFGRPGFDLEAVRRKGLQLGAPWEERLLEKTFFLRQLDISSSDIRHRVAEGLSIRYLVPPSVEMYIAEHGLYCC